MDFLQGKKILTTGMTPERSTVHGTARACRDQDAGLAFTYVVDRLEEHVRKMAVELGSEPMLRYDAVSDDEVNQTLAGLGKHRGGLSGLVHSTGSAPKEVLSGDFLDSIGREAFNTAHETSAYSLPVLAKAVHPIMQGHNGSIVALTYLGAVCTTPNYGVMGMAKVSLGIGTRFIAACLDCKGIRRSGISANPIKTLATSGIADSDRLLGHVTQQNPLGRNVIIEEVGNAVAFLLSDLSLGVTGEITYVDGEYSINALSVKGQVIFTITKAV